jgi:hypothetical protein
MLIIKFFDLHFSMFSVVKKRIGDWFGVNFSYQGS